MFVCVCCVCVCVQRDETLADPEFDFESKYVERVINDDLMEAFRIPDDSIRVVSAERDFDTEVCVCVCVCVCFVCVCAVYTRACSIVQ